MKQNDALHILFEWDKKGRYVYKKRDLGIIFDEQGKTLDQTLARLVKSDILEHVAHGIYVFAQGSHSGSNTLELIARNLRRGRLSYESLESALSQWGVISQIPLDRITLMTTGRSGEYRTPYGVIEFIHTKAPLEAILQNIVERDGHALPIATKSYAYINLKSVGRNTDLVDMEELNA